MLNLKIAMTADSANGMPAVARLRAGDVQLTQNWKAETVQWRMDGSGWSTDSVFRLDAQVAPGVHYVEMMLTARDTVSGDSCMRVTGNYFMTSSADLYASIETNGSGLTQTFTAQLYGGGNAVAPFWSFGDGSTATGLQVTHTYAQPGLYSVLFSSGSGVAGNLTRKIHAGTGVDNLAVTQVDSLAGACDSVLMEVHTQPPYQDLRLTDILQSTVLSGNELFLSPGGSGWQSFPASITGRYRLPGQSLLQVYMRDANGGDYTKYLPVFIRDSCLAGNDTLQGYFWWDADADGIKDAQEGYMDSPGAKLKVFSYVFPPGEKGTFSMPLPDIRGEVLVDPFPPNAISTPDRLTFTSLQILPDFRIGVAASQVRISGKVFVDMNSDSLFNPSVDHPAKGVTVRLQHKLTTKDYYTFTDENGSYSTLVPDGYYRISVASPLPPGTILNPDTINKFILSTSSVISPLRMIPQVLTRDLKALLLPHDKPVPGGVFQLDLKASNAGTDTCKGQFQVAYDPQLQFLSTVPAGGIHDPVNATVTWYNQTLYPVSDSLYRLRFLLPVASPGDSLVNQAFLFTNPGVNDVDLTNNVYACTTKIGNVQQDFYKSVVPEGEGLPGLIHIHDRLNYHLSYTNNGAGRIQHLIVQDELPAALDMSSFCIEWMSHPADVIIRDHVVTFRYFDIGLPDTAQSADSARLDLVFSLLPSVAATQGTVVNNTARMWIDGQNSQWSNTTMQIIQFGVGIPEASKTFWKVFPNPFQETIMISTMEADAVPEEIQIKDATGKQIDAEMQMNGSSGCMIQTPSLAAGIYFLQIRDRKGNAVVKMIKW